MREMDIKRIKDYINNIFDMAKVKQLCVILLSFTFSSVALANPVLGSITSGNVSVSQQGNTTTVNQSTQQAIIQWNSFNIAAQEKTQFVQPNSSSVALNRVNPAQGASQIYGALTSNGKIIIVNAAGIHFGPGSVVNVGGMIASTSDISNANFLAGKYIFNIASPYAGSIINEGTITAANYGLVALLGNSVVNRGLIQAELGSIVLGSGNKFTLDFNGDQLINFTVDEAAAATTVVDDNGKPVPTGVSSTGTILADGGKVLVTASAAQGVLDNVVDMEGVTRAQSVSEQGGEIILSGGDNGNVNVGGTLDASGATAGTAGGTVKVLGNNITLASTSNINTSGYTGGGDIYIGGDERGGGADQNALTTTVAVGSILNASTYTSGNAGNIVVWSNNNTQFHGSIYAMGGSALGSNGGNAETSAENLNVSGAYVNLLAANGNTGTWLLDPATVTISTSFGSNSSGYAPTSGASTSNVYIGDLTNSLATANINITTANSGSAGSGTADITVSTPITWNQATSLTLTAGNKIFINGAITAPLGTIVLSAASTAAQSITSGTEASPNSAGVIYAINVANFSIASGQFYQSSSSLPAFNVTGSFNIAAGTTYNNAFNGTFTRVTGGSGSSGSPYTISDVYGLQGVATMNLSSYYNLANDIDATTTVNWNGTAGFVPISGLNGGGSGFAGTLNGNNYVISNLYINQGGQSSVGLVGNASNGAQIQNIGLINPNITGGNFVGGILGNSQGAYLTNVFVSGGSISGTGQYIGGVGGVGRDVISSSWSSATVTGTTAGANFVGGLIGHDLGYNISNSYSTGAVTSASGSSDVGGLVGANDNGGTISNSYSTGAVTGSGVTNIGGFIGLNSGAISNSFFDTGTSGTSTGVGSGSSTGLTGNTFAGTLSTTSTYSNAGWSIGTGTGNTWYMQSSYMRPLLESNYSTTISTPEQLELVNIAPGASYTLGLANVNASATSQAASEWGNKGFFTINVNFAGTFNGIASTNGGNAVAGTITNLYMNNGSYGLFAGLTTGGTIENLGLINANLTNTGGGNGGLLVGTMNAGTITNVYTTGTITSSYTGGLVGVVSGGTITNVYSSATVNGNNDVGGLFGQMTGGTLTNGFSTGAVNGLSSSYSIGGLIGYFTAGTAKNVYSTGAVSAGSGASVGGLIGFLNGGTVNYGYTSSLVTSSSSGIGAISGNTNVGTLLDVFADSLLTNRTNLFGANSSGSPTETGDAFIADVNMNNSANFTGFSFYNTQNSESSN
jgi:filamentous hemagglutinin family protein